MSSNTAVDCTTLVRDFIRELSRYVKRDIEQGSIQLSLTDIVRLAIEFTETHGGCDTPRGQAYLVFLFGQMDSLNKIVFDKAMEAMSAHLEKVPEEVYATLSIIMTRYAMHEINLVDNVASLLRTGLELGGEPLERLLGMVEPILFAAVARFLAVAELVSNTPSSELQRTVASIEQVISHYMYEEGRALTAIKFYMDMILSGTPQLIVGDSDDGKEATEDNSGHT
ncbi:hypothetical protein [Pyrodictium delaneyi]|nr:hypothetical protein [Pyrodictium delaneyi]